MRNKLNQVQNKVLMASAFDSVSAIIRNKTNAYKQSQEAFALQRKSWLLLGRMLHRPGLLVLPGSRSGLELRLFMLRLCVRTEAAGIAECVC